MGSNGCALLEPASVGRGYAPLPYVNGMAEVSHARPFCDFKYPTRLPTSSKVDRHSTRGICSCMTAFQADREVVAEFLSRDLVLTAFWNCLSMLRVYGIERVLEDAILYQVITKYQHLSSNFAIQRTCRQAGWPDYHDAVYPLLSAEAFDTSDKIRMCLNNDRKLWIDFLSSWRRDCERCPFSHMARFDFSNLPWNVALNRPNEISVAFKINPENSRLALLRLEVVLREVTLDGLLTVISDVEMTTSWCPYITFPFKVGLREAKVVRRQGRLDQSSLYRVDLPWPFNNREALLQGWLVDDLDAHGLTVISFRAVDPDYPMPAKMEPVGSLAASVLQGEPIFVDGTCCLREIDPTTIWLGVCWNLDLKMSIPSSLLSFVSKSFVKMGIEALAKAARNAASDQAWQKRKKENPWLYHYVQHRMSQWRQSAALTQERDRYQRNLAQPISTASTDAGTPEKRRKWNRPTRWFRSSSMEKNRSK